MNLELMKKIVDGAPKDGRYYCTTTKMYHLCDDLNGFECCVSIADLRTELRARAPRDATHWQQKHDEYWLLFGGVYYLFNEGHWQRAKPDFDGMVEL